MKTVVIASGTGVRLELSRTESLYSDAPGPLPRNAGPTRPD
jgi:hypothetical protein